MDLSLFIRLGALIIPCIAIVMIGWVRQPSAKQWTGAILSTVWIFVILYPLQLLALYKGWWFFKVQQGLMFGVPIDLWIGWSLFWGGVLPLGFSRITPWFPIGLAFWLDLILMPVAQPILNLSPTWLWGEILCIGFALIPGFYLARWTQNQTQLKLRVSLQVIGFSGLVFGIIPLAIFNWSHGFSSDPYQSYQSWYHVLDDIKVRFFSPLGFFLIPLIFIFAFIGLMAVKEFIVKGQGSPVPMDPPQKLVTTGIYAYLTNPMQLASTMMMLLLAILMNHPLFYIYAFMSFLFSIGFAKWSGEKQLEETFGKDYFEYRQKVRAWIPRLGGKDP